ncbi:MAG: hypothetical protein IIZ83_09025 [Oscillospiraceae bacterium]|nr:hypothetical protein [Oscillospiraceae bacterium]
MSYCKKCGAYIPDGQDVCLACGFDEAAEKRKQNTSSSSAYAYAPKSDDELRREEELRQRAEQRRREQQEMNRKWAESEQRRRQMREDFERSQAEAAQRAREQQYQRTLNEDGYATLHRNKPYGSDTSFETSLTRMLSYMSYVSFLCFLPTLLGIQDPATKFHAKQGRKLFFASLVLSFIPGINAIAWLFQVALAAIGIRNVYNGKMEELPVIGRLGEK